jgi:hypothetical protein
MAHALNRRFLTVEDRVRTRVSPCAICGEYSQCSSGSPVNIITPWFTILLCHLGENNRSAVGRNSETQSHRIEMGNNNALLKARRATYKACIFGFHETRRDAIDISHITTTRKLHDVRAEAHVYQLSINDKI